MRKKIAAVAIVLAILSVYVCYLQFGREMDVVNSLSFSYANFLDEDIKVNLNKMLVTEDAEDIAEDIIRRVLGNDFHTIKFNFDRGYPNRLKVSVYRNEKGIGAGDMLFSFTYGQAADDGEIGDYNILQVEHMELEIHNR